MPGQQTLTGLPITWPYRLRAGHSDTPQNGACAMDAVNWLAHGKHGDKPECACPVIGAYVIVGNDKMPDDVRQRLLAYLPRIAGSRSAEHEAARARILVLAAVRIFAPAALDAAGLHDHAATLRSLPDDATYEDIREAASAATCAAADAANASDAAGATYAAASAATCAAESAAYAATCAAESAAYAAAYAWDSYFDVLDAALSAGPQGEPWSADALFTGTDAYIKAGGKLETVEQVAALFAD